MKTFLLDYDLHIIRKDLASRGHQVDLGPTTPISANAPDYFRLYFATPTGDIPFGIQNPPAAAHLLLHAYSNEVNGSVYAYVLRNRHIAGVFKLKAEDLLFCSTLFSEQNLLRESFLRDVHEILQGALSQIQETLPPGSIPENLSDEDILKCLYADIR